MQSYAPQHIRKLRDECVDEEVQEHDRRNGFLLPEIGAGDGRRDHRMPRRGGHQEWCDRLVPISEPTADCKIDKGNGRNRNICIRELLHSHDFYFL